MNEQIINETIHECINNNPYIAKEDIPYIVDTLNELIIHISSLPYNVDTTIAKLIDYNPEERMVDPMTQGIISRTMFDICEKLNLYVYSTEDSIGGLAYNYSFKKFENKVI